MKRYNNRATKAKERPTKLKICKNKNVAYTCVFSATETSKKHVYIGLSKIDFKITTGK